MRHVKALGLVVIVLFAFGGVESATSSAVLPVALPLATSSSPVKFVSKSGPTTFQTGSTVVTGTSDEATSEYLSTALGDFDLLLLGFKSSGVSCTGLPDTVLGSILALGTFHVVYLLNLSAKHIGVAYLLQLVHYSCSIILVRVRGCVLGLLERVNKKVTTNTAVLKQKSGVNEYTTYLNEENNGSVRCNLEASVGTGTFGAASLETTETNEKAEQGGKSVEMEVMA